MIGSIISIVILLSTLLGVILKISQIPLKKSIKVVNKKIKTLKAEAREVLKSLEKEEEDLRVMQRNKPSLTDKGLAQYNAQIQEMRGVRSKLSRELTNKVIRLQLLKLQLRVILLVIKVINLFRIVVTQMLSMGVVGVTMLIALSILVSTIYVSVIDGDLALATTVTTRKSGVNSINASSGKEYINKVNSIDWSQDFSSQLKQIQDQYGVEAKAFLELEILALDEQRKAVNKDGITFNIPGLLMGIKGIESGTRIPVEPNTNGVLYPTNRLSEGTAYVTGDLSTKSIKEVEFGKSTLYGCGSGGNRSYGCVDTGLFQFDSHHERYNSDYNQYKNEERQTKNGLPTYLPDAVQGLVYRLESYMNLPENDPRFETAAAAMVKLDSLLDTPLTQEEKIDLEANSLLTLYFAAINLHLTHWKTSEYFPTTGGLTRDMVVDFIVSDYLMLITYMRTYGIHSPASHKLVRSIKEKNTTSGLGSVPLFLSKDIAIKSYFGKSQALQSFPRDYEQYKKGNYGILDENGVEVEGTLFWYLYSKMNDKSKAQINSSVGMKAFVGSKIHFARSYYNMAALLVAQHDVQAIVNHLSAR